MQPWLGNTGLPVSGHCHIWKYAWVGVLSTGAKLTGSDSRESGQLSRFLKGKHVGYFGQQVGNRQFP